MKLNLVNQRFYNDVVPKLFRNRKFNPCITPETHIFAKNSIIYQMQFDNFVNTREVDFEEDEWRHDNHYIITDADRKPQKLIDLNQLKNIADE